MKNRKSRVLIIILVAFVVLAVGCTKNSGNKSGSSVSAPSENFNETGMPIVKDKLDLNFVFNSQTMTQDLDKLPMFAQLEEKSNIHINWDISRSGWEDKKAMTLASGDLPDAFFGAGLQDSDISSNLEYFVPLEDYIAKYAPNITKMFEQAPITKKMSTFPDGHIYGLPQIMPLRPSSNDTLAINKKWLDKLGLEVPTTIDEFFNVMMAFKTQDPNGNGIADEIPFNFANLEDARWFTARTLIGAWGVMYDMTFNYLVMKDGKVQYMPTMEEYKKLIMFLNKMYSSGLINQEVFTDDLSKFVALGKSPEVPILGSVIAWTPESVTGKWADEYIAIPPLKASKDITPLWGTNRSLVKYATNRFSISTKNKNIPETIRWIDEAYSQDMSLYLYYGSEGVGLKKNDDGTYEILQPTSADYDQDLWKWYNAPADFAPVGVLSETEAKIKDPSGYYSDRVEMGNIYDKYLLPDKDIYPLAKFEKADQDELSLLKTDITKYVDQKFAQWVTVGGIEKEWDGYLKELDKMNLNKMLEIYQKGHDNYYATE
jgi:putative aldouronate transport system substrate-binding protein